MCVGAGSVRSRGFSLVEIVIVVSIIGILAGFSMIAFGKNPDSTEAVGILSHLDSAKNAMLAYSMEHKTMGKDPLAQFVGAQSAAVKASLDKYLDVNARSGNPSEYYKKVSVRSDDTNAMYIGFKDFSVAKGIASALDDKITKSGGMYTKQGAPGASSYNVWLRLR